MSLEDCAGAEGDKLDLSNNGFEGENVFGSIVAGALKPGTRGSFHYKLASTDVTFSAMTFKGSGNGNNLAAAFYQFQIDFKLHQNGTQKDFALFSQNKGQAGGWEVRYEGATDGKLHLFVANVEVGAAQAPAAPLDAGFTLTVYLGKNSKLNNLYIDYWDGLGPILKQNDTGTQFVAVSQVITVGTSPGSGATSNLDIECDNYTHQTSNASGGSPALVQNQYVDIVAELPTGDGTNLQWKNHLGTACNVGGTNCYTEVNERPSVITTYITATATNQTLNEDVVTSNVANLHASDIVYGMRIGARCVNSVVAGATLTLTTQPNVLSSTTFGSGTNLTVASFVTDKTSAAQNITPAQAVAEYLEASIQAGANAATPRVQEMYKFIAFFRGRRRWAQII